MTPEQQAQAPDLLRRGPTAWGFQGERWPRARVATMLKQEFGVQSHPAYVSRLLRQWGRTPQKPIWQARQRDEGKGQEWREETWPVLEKRGQTGRITVFGDKAGYPLLPTVVRTYAPRGETPVQTEETTRAHWAAIHRSQPVQEYLAAGHTAEIELASLPGYAPELNPAEGVGDWTKRDLANASFPDLATLQSALRRSFQRLRVQPQLIQGFFAHAGYL